MTLIQLMQALNQLPGIHANIENDRLEIRTGGAPWQYWPETGLLETWAGYGVFIANNRTPQQVYTIIKAISE